MRAIWGVTGHWHRIHAGDMRDGAVLWAIAIVSYSEGVGLGDAGACGRYGVSWTVCVVSAQAITARSRIGWRRDAGAIWRAEGH